MKSTFKNVLAAVGMVATGAFLMAAGNAVTPNEPSYDWECGINGAQPFSINGVLKTQDSVLIVEGSAMVMASTNMTCMREIQ